MIGIMVPGGLQLIELKRAGWSLAAQRGLETDAMDSLIERIERTARHNVLRRALAQAANDERDDGP